MFQNWKWNRDCFNFLTNKIHPKEVMLWQIITWKHFWASLNAAQSCSSDKSNPSFPLILATTLHKKYFVQCTKNKSYRISGSKIAFAISRPKRALTNISPLLQEGTAKMWPSSPGLLPWKSFIASQLVAPRLRMTLRSNFKTLQLKVQVQMYQRALVTAAPRKCAYMKFWRCV